LGEQPKVTPSHVRGTERQKCHDLPKIPGWNVLCVLVHCSDVAPRPPPPVSVASCEKQQVSDTSILVDKTVGLQHGLVERTHNEQCRSISKKTMSMSLTFDRTWRAFFDLGESAEFHCED